MLHELQVEAGGERLDVWLEARLEGCSRSLVSRCIKDGLCTVTPGKAKPGFKLRGGEQIAIEVPELEPLEAVPEDLPLSVLFEDDELIVIDKAPGMVVHPAIGHPQGTLVNGLLGLGHGAGGEPWRPGLIHRLDADTSGVIAVAKTAAALAWYQEQFRERRVQKRYLALVAGRPKADWFTCEGAIGRHPKDFRRRAISDRADAKAAYTSFSVRSRCDDYAVVEARPKTGRTHQIRVHLAHLGHAVLADRVYGRSGQFPPIGVAKLSRQALHAWALALPRPDGTRLVCRAPVPADLLPFCPDQLPEPDLAS
jgi:23S rRNA pseudouridine1911/1915/1917 synthase